MKRPTVITQDTPLYNSRTILNYFEMLDAKYPHVDQKDLRSHAGMSVSEISDPGHWFTQKQIDLFYGRLVELTENPHIAREAGLYMASADAMGPMKHYLVSFLSPTNLYRMIGHIAGQLTLTSHYSSRKIDPNTIEVEVSFFEGVNEKEYQCENRQASLESVLTLFKHANQHVEHPECIFRGGKVCRYLISWKEKQSTRYRKLRDILSIAAGATGLVVLSVFGSKLFFVVLPWLIVILALFSWRTANLDSRELRQYLQGFREPSHKLLDMINANYDHANTINEIGQAISASTSVDEIIGRVVEIMEQQLEYRRGLIMIADQDRQTLDYRAGYGLTPEQKDILDKSPVPIESGTSQDPLLTAFFTGHPQHVEDTRQVLQDLTPISKSLVERLAVKSFLCCPIVFNDESLGILAVDYGGQDKPLIQSDINLLMGIAQVLAVRIRNAALLEEQLRQNQEIISLEKARTAIAAEKEKSDALAGELQEINEELKNFTYIVSHDLRAPLVNIRGFANELRLAISDMEEPLEKCRETLSEQEKELLDIALEEDIPEALEFIDSSVSRMDGQINGILKLSRIGRRELQPEPIDLQEMVESIVKTLAHQLEQRRASVEIRDLPTVHGDRTSLEQIFGNLLDNGVKYLEPDRPGKITVQCQETGKDFLFTIEDNGRGIAEGDLDKIFSIFQRVGRRDTQGEGLGLAYVKTLVRRLGGRIRCESTLGKGTIFFVSLPAHRSSEHPSTPEAP